MQLVSYGDSREEFIRKDNKMIIRKENKWKETTKQKKLNIPK